MVIRVLVSACLLGEPVRYHGGDARLEAYWLDRLAEEGRVVPFCPEVAGGLEVPRPPAEIVGGDGIAVLQGTARVATDTGEDVTEAFLDGAQKALDVARQQGVRLAILVERSPSCGSEQIYDGTFSGKRRSGSGVTAALLEEQGIRVFGQDRLLAAAAYLQQLESSEPG